MILLNDVRESDFLVRHFSGTSEPEFRHRVEFPTELDTVITFIEISMLEEGPER